MRYDEGQACHVYAFANVYTRAARHRILLDPILLLRVDRLRRPLVDDLPTLALAPTQFRPGCLHPGGQQDRGLGGYHIRPADGSPAVMHVSVSGGSLLWPARYAFR
jgi:hypothetical protein